MSKISNLLHMDKASLKKLSKSELINLLLKQEKKPKIIIVDDTKPSPKLRRPVPTPRKSVKDMVKEYEDNIISPPPEFRDKPIPLTRTKNHRKLLFHHQNSEINLFRLQELKNHFLKKNYHFKS